MMLPWIRVLSVACIALTSCHGGCTGDDPTTDVADCDRLCSGIEACGLLPSPLGFGSDSYSRLSSCVGSCEASPVEASAPLLACAGDDAPSVLAAAGSGHLDDLWCKASSAVDCRELRDCLVRAVPTAAVVPTAGVLVRVGLDSHSECLVEPTMELRRAEPTRTDWACGGEDESRAPESCGSATSFCTEFEVTEVEVILQSENRIVARRTVACQRFADRGALFDGLTVGPVRAAVRFIGAAPTAEGGSGGASSAGTAAGGGAGSPGGGGSAAGGGGGGEAGSDHGGGGGGSAGAPAAPVARSCFSQWGDFGVASPRELVELSVFIDPSGEHLSPCEGGRCDNGDDDDADSLTDCADDDCRDDPACAGSGLASEQADQTTDAP